MHFAWFDEVLGIALLHRHAGVGVLHGRAVAGEERDDSRHRLASHGADRTSSCCGRGRDADEVAGLLLGEDETARVRGLVLERCPGEVDDREVRVGELLRDGGERVAHEEPDPDHEVVAAARALGEVGT